MAFFAVTMVAGPAWDPARGRREQPGWDVHAAFMDRLVAEGLVLLGGPLGRGEHVLLVVEAASAQQVRDRLAEDPWAAEDRLRIGALEPWTVWLDGR